MWKKRFYAAVKQDRNINLMHNFGLFKQDSVAGRRGKNSWHHWGRGRSPKKSQRDWGDCSCGAQSQHGLPQPLGAPRPGLLQSAAPTAPLGLHEDQGGVRALTLFPGHLFHHHLRGLLPAIRGAGCPVSLGALATTLQDPPRLLAVRAAAAALPGTDALPAPGVRVPGDATTLGA